MVTILHISDLHRSNNEPINNDTLLSSLLADRDRYLIETPKIPTPSFAVVSGDIIQGVRLGQQNFTEELERQYEVATDFLIRLADLFFDGDRSRIAIVPGNHDVCWNTARASMTELPPDDEPKKIGPHLFSSSSPYRWSWSERKIYKISAPEIYEKRLAPYCKFIEAFYSGVEMAHPIDPKKPLNFYEFDGGRILLTAFNSVHGNDCYCNHGAIQAGAIGNCSLKIRNMPRQPILKISTWHHSLQGPPQRDDYMDTSTVHEMIGAGFQLGLHGHQHQADASAYNIHLPEEQSMAIISAGSLCAGAAELPRGTNRQYNLITISSDYSTAQIHVREMSQGNQFGRCRQGLFGPDGFVEMKIADENLDSAIHSEKIARFSQQTILCAEDALKSGHPEIAFSLLSETERENGTHARRLYLEAAKELEKWSEIISFLSPATTMDEFLLTLQAHEHLGNLGEAVSLLALSAANFGIDSATIAELASRIQLRQALGK
ncbi:metallophosphoesterase [Massilia sp. Dwa41.01b]|uniref:metallophosphoesterase family protein n=1 Tax=unclassified Massilia TaxID=2609279 RepID=UPI0016034458|nr:MULTISPECIES: metallophosphoesterase [unclassified Massilia]QNA90711.1 metallophosphoesterase [Massilia sp. Dwa41.01b]QNA97946.1 metallophosphoesterase [Massilia sp. Se16.2.3]